MAKMIHFHWSGRVVAQTSSEMGQRDNAPGAASPAQVIEALARCPARVRVAYAEHAAFAKRTRRCAPSVGAMALSSWMLGDSFVGQETVGGNIGELRKVALGAEIRPNVGQTRPRWAILGPARAVPNSGKLRPTLAECGRMLVNICRMAQKGPNSG